MNKDCLKIRNKGPLGLWGFRDILSWNFSVKYLYICIAKSYLQNIFVGSNISLPVKVAGRFIPPPHIKIK